MHGVAVKLARDIDRWNPSFMILPTPPPKGTTASIAICRAQSAVIIGEVGEVPPLLHVVVDEILQEHLVHHCAFVRPGHAQARTL